MTTDSQTRQDHAERERSDLSALMDRSDISPREKLRRLESWQSDLIQLEKADEENMPRANGKPGETAAMLAAVTAAISTLRERSATGR